LEQKVRRYLLDPDHPVGGPKARFFLARGFADSKWQVLAAALRHHRTENPVAQTISTTYGEKQVIRCRIQTPDGLDPCIRTVWMVEAGQSPRLVTAYPKPD
jgi:hypothetical protein